MRFDKDDERVGNSALILHDVPARKKGLRDLTDEERMAFLRRSDSPPSDRFETIPLKSISEMKVSGLPPKNDVKTTAGGVTVSTSGDDYQKAYLAKREKEDAQRAAQARDNAALTTAQNELASVQSELDRVRGELASKQ